MITTGYPGSSATKTEIIDIASGGVTCSDLADFPVELDSAVGGNLKGTPVVCGGYSSTSSDKCYKFTTTGGWQEFASMKDKRDVAAGIVYKKKLHVFGGYDGSQVLQSSEIISEDGGVIDGPDLPTAVMRHAITAINSTVSILSGGSANSNSASSQTWFYNHETEAFSSGPTLLEGRRWHASATIVDKVTKAKIPVVTGGYNNGDLDSTELLIDGHWQTGKIQCRKQNIILICFYSALCLTCKHCFLFIYIFNHIRTTNAKCSLWPFHAGNPGRPICLWRLFIWFSIRNPQNELFIWSMQLDNHQ